MKNLLILGLSFAMACSAAYAQEAKPAIPSATSPTPVSGPQITFEQNKFDFGTANEGDNVEHVFKFRNTGNQPLILSNVQTTCGCTVPEWPKEPIMPGKSSSIKATFNTTGKGGQQNKVITIISNAAEGNTMVSMQGTVNPKSPGSQAGQNTPNPHHGHNHSH